MLTSEQSWNSDLPTEPGFYWFYGCPWMGQSGRHFEDDFVPKMELYSVEFKKRRDGVYGVVCGQFMPSRKFDKSKSLEGYIGKFTPAIIPELPIN